MSTDGVHPYRWAIAAFVGLVLLVAVVLGPVWAVHQADHHADVVNHRSGCVSRQNLWDTLDALIVQVDKASPGVRDEYEPLLGARPTC